MSAIPPIEPARPAHGARPVRRRTAEEEQDERPAGGFDRGDSQPQEDEADDDGLPHVDIRV